MSKFTVTAPTTADANGSYAGRPWSKQYAAGIPLDIVPEFTDMLSMLAASVDRDPNAAAIKYFDGLITFSQLDERSTALAAALISNGFEPGDRLGLYLQNDPAFLYGLIAAWKAGGAGVCINPMNKQRELTYLIKDSGAGMLLCLDSLYEDVVAEVLAAGEVALKTVIVSSPLDDQTRNDVRVLPANRAAVPEGVLSLRELLVQFSDATVPAVSPGWDTLAVLTYTSGTTGEPKGAMNTHGGMAFNAQTFRDWAGLTLNDDILGVAPLFHISGLVGGIALMTLTGATLILSHRFESNVMMDSIREHKPAFTLGAITVFINLSHLEGLTHEDWSCFRVIFSGGAAIAPAVNQQFLEKSGIYIHTAYGLTETTSPSHLVPVGARSPVDPTSGALSVGLPTFNTMSRILDEDGAELPAGEVGEIAIAGPQVVPGYWQRPDATAKGFPNGELLTGDVGFMDSDGWFYIVDRKKDLINASGYKVWPREVEDILYAHPAVREAAVVGVPDDYRGETVKAFVSLKPAKTATEKELIEFCKSQMAAYKYPRSIDIVDELPKTTTGKILRRELRVKK